MFLSAVDMDDVALRTCLSVESLSFSEMIGLIIEARKEYRVVVAP